MLTASIFCSSARRFTTTWKKFSHIVVVASVLDAGIHHTAIVCMNNLTYFSFFSLFFRNFYDMKREEMEKRQQKKERRERAGERRGKEWRKIEWKLLIFTLFSLFIFIISFSHNSFSGNEKQKTLQWRWNFESFLRLLRYSAQNV